MTSAIIAFVLGIIWIIGFFFMGAGAWIHLFLAVAVVLTIIRMSKKPVR